MEYSRLGFKPATPISDKYSLKLHCCTSDKLWLRMVLVQSNMDPSRRPRLEIVEQPKQRGMRFRYECEGRSAGSIPGKNTNGDRKTWPSCQILNYSGHAIMRVSLVSKDDPAKPHPHSLVGRDCNNGVCQVNVDPSNQMLGVFPNLGIQCVKRKEVSQAIQDRLNNGINPFATMLEGDERSAVDVDLNIVRLCFEAFIQDSRGKYTQKLDPVVSDPIYDKKATCSSVLKICRVDKTHGSCMGNEEVFLLCDKVQKEDIQVVFFRDGWEALGDFNAMDVHRQVAIVFRTPPFCNSNLQEKVDVHFKLRRPSDHETSKPLLFTYLPVFHEIPPKHKFPAPHHHPVVNNSSRSGEIRKNIFNKIKKSNEANNIAAQRQFQAHNLQRPNNTIYNRPPPQNNFQTNMVPSKPYVKTEEIQTNMFQWSEQPSPFPISTTYQNMIQPSKFPLPTSTAMPFYDKDSGKFMPDKPFEMTDGANAPAILTTALPPPIDNNIVQYDSWSDLLKNDSLPNIDADITKQVLQENESITDPMLDLFDFTTKCSIDTSEVANANQDDMFGQQMSFTSAPEPNPEHMTCSQPNLVQMVANAGINSPNPNQATMIHHQIAMPAQQMPIHMIAGQPQMVNMHDMEQQQHYQMMYTSPQTTNTNNNHGIDQQPGQSNYTNLPPQNDLINSFLQTLEPVQR